MAPSSNDQASNGETPRPADTAAADRPERDPMPIVGIGASAGGIDALQRFFRELPAETGMAFVVILHLAPDRESNLAGILQSCTDLPVEQAADGTEVQTDHVYVIAPGHRLTLREGVLRVSAVEGAHDVATIDRFFRSLAEDQGRNAVGVVLSGSGSDGTLGLRAINEKGGVAFAQVPEDAEYDDMPQSAIATGLVDLTASAGTLAEMLVQYRDHAGAIQVPERVDTLGDDGQSALQKILARLFSMTGHDFSNYDRAMVLRRVGRRLQLTAAQSLDEYRRRLQNDEEETRALYKDLLVSITNFFRDPEAFAALEEQVIPKLFEGKGPDDQVRVWVPGCATGEEAYSMAMLLVEYADTLDAPPELQVFATDVDQDALDTARERHYPEAIAADVTEDRLRRFFEGEGTYYRVDNRLREIILFSPHNVLADPPFSTLDLVSCRNLLVYLDADAKTHVYERFHYGLREGGFLFLGRNEGTQAAEALFSTVDAPNTILKARALSPDERTYLPFQEGVEEMSVMAAPTSESAESSDLTSDPSDLAEVHHRVLMDAVASLLVNDNGEIVHLSDGASRYLRFREGTPSRKLFPLVPDALRPELQSALYQAFQKGRTVERTGLSVKIEGEPRMLRLFVRPVEQTGGEQLAHVRIEERPRPAPPEAPDSEETDRSATNRPGTNKSDTDEPDTGLQQTDEISNRQEELDRTREQLQTTTEKYEAVWRQLELANEQLRSANEELRSKNQEMETRREELQSLNEELQTTNQERKAKIEELREANSVLENLMDATEIATLFLDRDLTIQRYTPRVTELFNIQPADVGRSLSDFTQRFEYEDLMEDAKAALYDLDAIERELHTSENRWFLLRVRPYRTVEDEIRGVVLSFIDITERRMAEEARRRSEELHRLAVDAGKVGTWSVDLETGEAALSPRKAALLGIDPDEHRPPSDQAESEFWQQVVPQEDWAQLVHPDDRDPMEQALVAARETGAPFEIEYRAQHADGVRWIYSKGEVTHDGPTDGRALRGASVDITELKEAQEELLRERNFVNSVLDTVGALVMVLDREGRILRVNDECEAVTGYSADELRGSDSFERLVPPDEVPEVRDSFLALLRGEAPIRIENHVRTKDGDERLIDWTSTVLRDEAGTVQFVIGTGIDVTERRALEQEVIDAGERVRREIGQDLHDVLSSDLAALAMKADNLKRKVKEALSNQTGAVDALQDIIGGIRTAAERSRTLSHALIPVSLQEEHLAAALDNLCREQEELTGTTFTFEGDREERLPRDDETAMHLYRIAHEALSNVHRHAQADHVWVSLRRTDAALVLTVKDDGVGLPDEIDSASSGVGLRSMDYRASVIGAALAFESGDEGGAVVRCALPLDKARAE
ncbi:hypothetical protein BSZ35_18740 [Salinibacter sp. 10B]|uniref:chemotaxis protein CheB n=1 Tax=Salinibacter sp. 10B TaxID=1923971 RepID=UPI000D2ABB55|nr:chemotaxis protein CheB [Salinibacter sp. 10B]PQJ26958.1 hypothetical protein BSZ35_18740 [Salinibacter sp. 10B]